MCFAFNSFLVLLFLLFVGCFIVPTNLVRFALDVSIQTNEETIPFSFFFFHRLIVVPSTQGMGGLCDACIYFSVDLLGRCGLKPLKVVSEVFSVIHT